MPAPTSITDLSTTASSNYPAGTDLPSALDDAVRALASVVKYNVSKGTDIASASSITIPAQGSYFVVTGTTTITTIADTNAFAGREVTLKFSGALTLTHSAGLILPGSANITTAAGDVAKVVFESTGVWRCTTFTSGQALTDADIGVSVQAYDALLASLAGQTVAANKIQAYSASDTASLLDFKDEDDMASNSATAVPSQQSVKAYVDAEIAASTSITLGTPQASTSGTSIDFTSIPTGTKMIVLSCSGVGTSGTSIPILRLGDSGGVETSGYVGEIVSTTQTDGFRFYTSWTAAAVANGSMILTLLDSSTNTWACLSTMTITGATGYGGGSKSLSGELDRISLTTVGGSDTFDAGKVNILYFG